MSAWVIALLGGSVGTALTWAFGAVGRYRLARGEAEHHDRLARERDEDLAQWVADDHLRLTRELNGIVTTLATEGLLYAGALGTALGHAKEKALHAYRGQERAAQRFIAELSARESWTHRRHRRRRGARRCGSRHRRACNLYSIAGAAATWGIPRGRSTARLWTRPGARSTTSSRSCNDPTT